jgi:tRNA nucleotidyltransferase/poly(A) polymerase
VTQRLHPITPDRIDPDAAKVVRRLTRHGFEAFLVGGCVRDLLLGRTPKDFDVATSATPEELKQLFRNCRIIGRRFRLAHIFFGRKIIETATFRTVPRTSDDGTDPMIWHDNEFGTAKEDALRRDFTINGLFYDIVANQVIDAVDGLHDLRAGRVRLIGEPSVRAREDPVRILRAIKFTSRLGMQLDEATRDAMIQHRGLIAECSIARVLEEIYRLLRSGTAAPAFRQMHELGILEVLFPELAVLLPPSSTPGTETEVPAVRAGRRRKSRPHPAQAPASPGSPVEEGVEQPFEEAAAEGEAVGASHLARADEERSHTPNQHAHQAQPDEHAHQAQPDEHAHQAQPDEHAHQAQPDDPISDERELSQLESGDSADDTPPASEREAAHLLLCRLGLANAAARTAAGESLLAQLEVLDALVQRSERPPLEPVLLGAALSPLARPALEESRRMGQTVELIDLLVKQIGQRIHASRRHRERLKQILVAQRRLTVRRRRRNLKEREYFNEARQLLRLRAEAAGEPDPLQHSTNEPDSSQTRRRRGRRRRGGRRRGNRNGDNPTPESDSASSQHARNEP